MSFFPSMSSLAAVNPVVQAASATEVLRANSSKSFSASSVTERRPVVAHAPIEMHSPSFYAACCMGGILSCGLTHMMVTPLDLVKCNMQVDAKKFPSIMTGFSVLAREQGLKGLTLGWAPTLMGYSMQGMFKFGLYEFFKKYYSDLAGEPFATENKTLVFLAGSASAEFFADIALCPFEAVKVKIQTTPGYAKGWSDGFPKLVNEVGYGGLYRGLTSLWGRQIPYTMMKFASFERTVEALYANVMPKPKSECSKPEQLGVSFVAGYIAGIFCAVVSHPADNLVSKLNKSAEASVSSVVSEMGVVGLFTRGLPLRVVMVGTLTGLQWGIYDAFKVAVGLPTTGSAPPPSK